MKFGTTLDRLVDIDLAAGNTVFLAGESAIGKSSYVKSLAERHGTEVFTMNCNLLETKEDLNGVRLVPTADESSFQQEFFPVRAATEAITYAIEHPNENPIMFCDEANRTSPGTVSALLTMITDRTLGDRKVPDNLVMVFAGNIQGNISMFDEASLSRFSIYRVAADAETFLKVHDGELHELIVESLKEDGDRIFQRQMANSLTAVGKDDDDDDDEVVVEFDANTAFVETEQLAQITAPRTIMALNRFLNEAGDDILKELLTTESTEDNTGTLFDERVFGYVGRTEFAADIINRFATRFVGSHGTSSAGAWSIPMPSSYTKLEGAANEAELRTEVSMLNDVIAEQSLLFALTSSRNTAPRIVSVLSERVTSLSRQNLSVLYQNNASIKRAPMEALTSSSTPLGNDPSIIALSDLVS